MYDLITIGSISIDMYYQGDSLTQKDDRFALALGGKYLVDHFYAGLGGGAANVAVGVEHHGFNTAIVGKIGKNQFKKMILEHLENNKITDKYCQYEDDYMKISSILLAKNGERTILHYETPHEHILRTDEDLETFKNAKIVYMSNLWRVPLAERQRILAYAKKNGVKTIVNLGIADCRRTNEQIDTLLQHVDILIVNTHECAELLKIPFDQVDWKSNIKSKLTNFEDKELIVTDGVKGSYWYSNETVLHVKAVPVDHVLDTTGAGDGYTAGFISGYLEKKDIEHAMKLGAKHAAKIVQKIGAN